MRKKRKGGEAEYMAKKNEKGVKRKEDTVTRNEGMPWRIRRRK